MKTTLTASLIALLVFSTARAGAGKFTSNEILIRLDPNTSLNNETRKFLGERKQYRVGKDGTLKIRLKKGETPDNVISKLKKNHQVELVEPNYIFSAHAVPNDPDYGELWGLKNTGQTVTTGNYSNNNPGFEGLDIDVETLWDKTTDCSSTIIAVIDTGVNYNQEDLALNMWNGTSAGYPNHGYDFVDTDNAPLDLNGHGTHSAGIIGARGNNGVGTTGVCWSAKIMAVRVLDADGNGTAANITNGIEFAITNGAKIINMSFGSTSYSATLSNAIQHAREHGILVVVSAGNQNTNLDSGTDASYPCSFSHDNIICVAALDQEYNIAGFSNYGLLSVDIGAPGTNIRSPWYGEVTTYSDDMQIDPWTTTGAWGYQQIEWGYLSNIMSNPVDWDDGADPDDPMIPTHPYAASANDWVFKNFGGALLATTKINTAEKVRAEFKLKYSVEEVNDSFTARYAAAAGQPTAGTLLGTFEGDNGVLFDEYSWNLPLCAGQANCTLGFNLQSNGSVEMRGVAVADFVLYATDTDAVNGYVTTYGTSTAAPHVAGVAALLKTLNPDYTYLDLINAILGGGEANSKLTNKLYTGKALDTWTAYKYVIPPTGVTASY